MPKARLRGVLFIDRLHDYLLSFVEFWNTVNYFDGLPEINADGITIPFYGFPPWLVFIIDYVQRLLSRDHALPYLIAPERIVLRKTCDSVINIIIKWCSAVSYPPG
jgi:hypothetical protein